MSTLTPVSALPSSRWRLFADAVAALLGLNVWVSLVLLPGLFVGAWSSTEDLAVAAAPLAVLGLGLWRRNEIVLLLAYPVALLVPVGLAPEMGAAHVYGPTRFAFVALGLVGYLFGASVFTSFREAPPPERVRSLAGADGPAGGERWRRRFRVYAELSILSALFPLALVWAINFDDTAQEYLLQMYPGRATLFSTLMNLGAFAVWLLVFGAFFLGALRPHRTGDHALRARLDRLARRGSGRVRPIFYASILVALGLMALLVWYRS